MKKPSKIQARIAEARKAKHFEDKDHSRPIWDEFHTTYMNCCECKDKILTACMSAVDDLLKADELQPLLNDFDHFELKGALKLLDSDYAHYSEQLESIYKLHAKFRGGFTRESDEKTQKQAEVGLTVSGRYADLQKFFDSLIAMNNTVIFSIIHRFEVRQRAVNESLVQEPVPV